TVTLEVSAMQIDHGLEAPNVSLAPPVSRRRVRMAPFLVPLVGLALAVVAVFPVLYMFSASLMQPEQVGSTPLQLLPHPVRWRNFGDIFSQFNIGSIFAHLLAARPPGGYRGRRHPRPHGTAARSSAG